MATNESPSQAFANDGNLMKKNNEQLGTSMIHLSERNDTHEA